MTRGFTLLAGERAILYHTHRARQVRACVRTCVLEWRVLSLFGTQSSLYQTFITSSKARHQRLLSWKKKQPQLVQPVFSRGFFLFLSFKYNVLTERFTDSTKSYENPQCSYRGKVKKQQQRKCVRETGSSDTPLFYIHSREKRLPMRQVTKTQYLSAIYDMRYRFYYFHTAFNPRDRRTERAV